MAIFAKDKAPTESPREVERPFESLRFRLIDLVNNHRAKSLDGCESYYRCAQYDQSKYDWDGNFRGYGGEADIKPGWYVPLKRRKPATRYDLARVIVNRFTALLFGKGRWPEVTVEGDEDAEDYAKALVEATKLQSKMSEARMLGGAMGTACLSFAFIDGKPRVQVHNSKHVTVLSWDDQEDFRVGAVLEAYTYTRRIWDDPNDSWKDVELFYARYWDDKIEAIWEPIPKEVAERADWFNFPAEIAEHGLGFTPFYWVQNIPDSYNADGECDYHGLEDLFDSINRLFSATVKGTIANVDPTLVVKMSPEYNDGTLRKGSENVIFSEGGAEYVELRGQSVAAATQMLERMRQYALDSAGVVMPDPEKLSAARAQSGESLKLLYMPMLARADILREQYGQALIGIVKDMLRASRTLGSQQTLEVDERGQKTLTTTKITLPPRVERTETKNDGNAMVEIERTPGTSENVSLRWPDYFPATTSDLANAFKAAREATGGKQVLSLRSAVKLIASHAGIVDIDQELEDIEADAEKDAERSSLLFRDNPLPPLPELPQQGVTEDEPSE